MPLRECTNTNERATKRATFATATKRQRWARTAELVAAAKRAAADEAKAAAKRAAADEAKAAAKTAAADTAKAAAKTAAADTAKAAAKTAAADEENVVRQSQQRSVGNNGVPQAVGAGVAAKTQARTGRRERKHGLEGQPANPPSVRALRALLVSILY